MSSEQGTTHSGADDAAAGVEMASVPAADLTTLRQFFAALSDEGRLALCGALAATPDGLGSSALAVQTGQKPNETLKHLALLEQAEIVQVRERGGQRIYTLNVVGLRAGRKRLLARAQVASPADAEGTPAWEQQVLRAFFSGETLREIPVNAKKRAVVMRWLQGRFVPGQRYSEREVNALLQVHHADSAALRRELVDTGLLARDAGGSAYWRVEERGSDTDSDTVG